MKQYKNPILPGFNPDPSICRLGSDYYLSTSSFWYFPMLPIYHSRDLINWTLINHAINRKDQNFYIEDGCLNGVFAATIRYHKKHRQFYMVSCYNDHPCPGRRPFLISTESPEKPWSSPVFIKNGCCDPSIFFDDDNKAYLHYVTEGQDRILQYEIDIETGKELSESVTIWQGTGGRFLEAPHVYRINGKYYLIAAEGGTEFGHYISIARSDNVNGPYESCPQNPILTHRDRATQFSSIQCTGHGDLIQATDGSWWLVCLGIRPIDRMVRALPVGRETFLAPIEWNDDGWPVVKNYGHSDGTLSTVTSTKQEMFEKIVPESWRDDFDCDKLAIDWSFIRTPRSKFWDLREKPGWIKITGKDVRIGQKKCPSMICTRQKHFKFSVLTKMLFTPIEQNDEAGLMIYSNDERHYEIGVKKHNDKNVIFVRKTVLDLQYEKEICEISSPEIFLKIVGTHEKYSLMYGNKHDILFEAIGGTTVFLTHPWTGNHFGIYAISTKNTPAFFDWVDYQCNE